MTDRFQLQIPKRMQRSISAVCVTLQRVSLRCTLCMCVMCSLEHVRVRT